MQYNAAVFVNISRSAVGHLTWNQIDGHPKTSGFEGRAGVGACISILLIPRSKGDGETVKVQIG
jgi:hypothetical protein